MSASAPLFPSDRYCVLIEFAHKHLDFQWPELTSILEMHGIEFNGSDCRLEKLPNQTTDERSKDRPLAILSFDQKMIGRVFCIDNKQKLASNQQIPDLSSILSQCTLIRSAMELWGVGSSFDECTDSTKIWVATSIGKGAFDRYSSPDQSWKVTVHTLGSTFTREEQDEMRLRFSHLDFKGTVQMKDPSQEYLLIRESELNPNGNPLYPRHGKEGLIPENKDRPPLGVYYGRVFFRHVKHRGQLDEYTLKKRRYLGPTSMDAELSLIMTNLAQAQGKVCFDPFVGTGSILVTCALRGAAYCVGTDIDLRVLRGRSSDENVWSNFDQFQLKRPELIRSDNALYHRHFRGAPYFDAIITDPPYGVRAGARQSGSKREVVAQVKEEHRHDHIAQTRPYPVSDVMADLLNVAARTLVMGGRLVYIIPSMTDFAVDTDLPRHDCFELVHVCYQPLSLELGRRVVTMKKIREFDPEAEYKIWVNGPASAEKCANLRERLAEASRQVPGRAEKSRRRKQKRKASKEAKKLAIEN